MRKDRAFLTNSVIVAAHPDDEILWFSSIMEEVDKVIIVFRDFWADPEIGAKRAAAIAELPHPNVVCLALPEPGSYGCANWQNPEPCDVGLKFGVQSRLRELKRRVKIAVPMLDPSKNTPRQSVAAAYRKNYHEIYTTLDKELSTVVNVFTHNPWGEYGHEDHVQVFRAVDALKKKHGFTQWMSNYCTNRSLPLAKIHGVTKPAVYLRQKTNISYAEEVAAVYRKHDCWTWDKDWPWFEEECFTEAPSEQACSGGQEHLFPLNFFSI